MYRQCSGLAATQPLLLAGDGKAVVHTSQQRELLQHACGNAGNEPNEPDMGTPNKWKFACLI